MKRYIVVGLIFVAFMVCLYQYSKQEEKETFNINATTTEEIIIALFIENIAKDVQKFYSQYYLGEIAVYIYEADVLEMKKEDTNSITVKIGVTPQVGAHNPLGYDELSYAVDARGNITLKNYEHVKTYPVPKESDGLVRHLK